MRVAPAHGERANREEERQQAEEADAMVAGRNEGDVPAGRREVPVRLRCESGDDTPTLKVRLDPRRSCCGVAMPE